MQVMKKDAYSVLREELKKLTDDIFHPVPDTDSFFNERLMKLLGAACFAHKIDLIDDWQFHIFAEELNRLHSSL